MAGFTTKFTDDVFGLEIFNTKDIVPAFSLTVTKSNRMQKEILEDFPRK
jgi:hypothetical protein